MNNKKRHGWKLKKKSCIEQTTNCLFIRCISLQCDKHYDAKNYSKHRKAGFNGKYQDNLKQKTIH